jgi:hypothetical protein
MQMFKIEPVRFFDKDGETVLDDGYAFRDYLSFHDREFDSREEAEEYLADEHAGPDGYGVNAEFKVVAF